MLALLFVCSLIFIALIPAFLDKNLTSPKSNLYPSDNLDREYRLMIPPAWGAKLKSNTNDPISNLPDLTFSVLLPTGEVGEVGILRVDSLQEFGSGAGPKVILDNGAEYYNLISENTYCRWGFVSADNKYYYDISLDFGKDVYEGGIKMKEPYFTFCKIFENNFLTENVARDKK